MYPVLKDMVLQTLGYTALGLIFMGVIGLIIFGPDRPSIQEMIDAFWPLVRVFGSISLIFGLMMAAIFVISKYLQAKKEGISYTEAVPVARREKSDD